MTPRAQLDAQMRAILAELSVVSHVPAAPWGPSGRSRSSDEPLGGSRPPGDLGGTVFARQYGPPFHQPTRRWPGARDDDHRAQIIQSARDELKHIRGRGDRQRIAGETPDDTVKRMLAQTEGWSPDEVERSRFHMSARLVRRHRRKDSRDPETGEKLPDAEQQRVTGDQRRKRLEDLLGRGYTLEDAARVMGISRSTAERALGRRAA